MNKKAFSLIEVLISVSIIIILAIVATSTSNNLKNNSNNSKVIADLNTIENALESYKAENQSIPLPGGNNNYFNEIGNYVHSFSSTGSYGVYGSFTENTLEKRFLDITPLDPRTNQYYSYGITKENSLFEIAGVIGIDDDFIAKVIGNYTAEKGPYSLIREYNGSNFVIDKGENLPYNPEERSLVVTTKNGENIYKSGDIIRNEDSKDLEIYFSDGSVSILSPGSVLILSDLDFVKSNNLVSKVNLFLQAGSIWTKATRLGEGSSFEIDTSDTTASVRGTIFGVEKEVSDTKVIVVEGIVDIYKKNVPTGTSPIQSQVLPGELPKKTIINTTTSGTTSIVNSTVSSSENIKIEKDLSNFDNSGLSSSDIIINNFIEEKIIDVNESPKDCYLENKLIENGSTATGYLSKTDLNCNSMAEIRTCINGNLDDNYPDYKFASCSGPNQCGPYNNDGYIGLNPINNGINTTLNKTKGIFYPGTSYQIGTLDSSLPITCNSGFYTSGTETHIPNCKSGFTPDGNSCKCDTGTDFFEGSCHENPFGSGYELVKTLNTLPGGASPYTLNTANVGVDLGSSFGIILDTDGISNSTTISPYLYTTDGTSQKDILFSVNNSIKLSTDGNINGNIVKYLVPVYNDTNLAIKFEGNIWTDVNEIMTTLTGSTYNIDTTKLKIINSKNIRIYKKKITGGATTGKYIVGNFYSGEGCDECPDGRYENFIGKSNICKNIKANKFDDISCSNLKGNDSKWEGYYYP